MESSLKGMMMVMMIGLECLVYMLGKHMIGVILLCFIIFFFFQAEDGIRDAQESRGLGDVYKRQHQFALGTGVLHGVVHH